MVEGLIYSSLKSVNIDIVLHPAKHRNMLMSYTGMKSANIRPHKLRRKKHLGFGFRQTLKSHKLFVISYLPVYTYLGKFLRCSRPEQIGIRNVISVLAEQSYKCDTAKRIAAEKIKIVLNTYSVKLQSLSHQAADKLLEIVGRFYIIIGIINNFRSLKLTSYNLAVGVYGEGIKSDVICRNHIPGKYFLKFTLIDLKIAVTYKALGLGFGIKIVSADK